MSREHNHLMQIDMDYRQLNRKKVELEQKGELTDYEKGLLEDIKERMNEMCGDIELNDGD